MNKTVFWSWQSDRDERVTRHLIREALVIALDRLNNEADIEDRLDIDHDTRGLSGSPDIVQAILDKIDTSDVFVADITPIAVSDSGKHVPNPNVLIELGYAKKSLGTGSVISVWNVAFTDCRVDDLPFDLRGRRGPIAYRLASRATKPEMAAARAELVEKFIESVGLCLAAKPRRTSKEIPWKVSVDGDPSIWVPATTPILINEDWGSGTKELSNGARWYVRILPDLFDPQAMDAGAHLFPPISGSFSWGNTKGGVLTYQGSVRAEGASPTLEGATMWFRDTGEIWAAHTGIVGTYKGELSFFGDYIPERWATFLWYALNALSKNGGKGPFRVRLGVTGLEGSSWPDVNSLGGRPPCALGQSFECEFQTPIIGIPDWRNEFEKAWADLRRVFSRPRPIANEVDEVLSKCR